jgi:hypothetical protein
MKNKHQATPELVCSEDEFLLDSDVLQLVFCLLMLEIPLSQIRTYATVCKYFDKALDCEEFWKSYVAFRYNEKIWKSFLARQMRWNPASSCTWKSMAQCLAPLLPRSNPRVLALCSVLSFDYYNDRYARWPNASYTRSTLYRDLDLLLVDQFMSESKQRERHLCELRLGDVVMLHLHGDGKSPFYYVVDHDEYSTLYLKSLQNSNAVPHYFRTLVDEDFYTRSVWEWRTQGLVSDSEVPTHHLRAFPSPCFEDSDAHKSFTHAFMPKDMAASQFRPFETNHLVAGIIPSWQAAVFDYVAWFPFNTVTIASQRSKGVRDENSCGVNRLETYCRWFQCSDCRFFEKVTYSFACNSETALNAANCAKCGQRFCARCIIYCDTCVAKSPRACFCTDCIRPEIHSWRYVCVKHFVIACGAHSDAVCAWCS